MSEVPISYQRALFVYQDGNDIGVQSASWMQSNFGMDSSQIIPITCDDDEIMPDYESFQSVESAIEEAIDHAEHDVWCLILGPGIPGGFYDGDAIVSSCSRLARIGTVYAGLHANPIYDRKSSKVLSIQDRNNYRVVSRIDGPDWAYVNRLLNTCLRVANNGVATGLFYLDPYSTIANEKDQAYSDHLSEFGESILSNLNMTGKVTNNLDADTDVIIPYVNNDSFVWSFGTGRGDATFFKLSAASRFFFYNADEDGGFTIRDSSSKAWCSLALGNGYASCAGAMSKMDSGQHLRPSPFFESLLSGATIGEAWLFALPYFDSPEALYGNPLISVRFPLNAAYSTRMTLDRGVIALLRQIDRAAGFISRRSLLASDIFYDVLTSSNVPMEVALVMPLWRLMEDTKDEYIDLLIPVFQETLRRASGGQAMTQQGLEDLLERTGYLFSDVSAALATAAGYIVADRHKQVEGWWSIDHVIADESPSVQVAYDFELQVATDEDFSDIQFWMHSASEITGWYVEESPGYFEEMPVDGVGSNYVGRKVRYESQSDGYSHEYLVRGNKYYARIRQVSEAGTGDWISYAFIVTS